MFHAAVSTKLRTCSTIIFSIKSITLSFYIVVFAAAIGINEASHLVAFCEISLVNFARITLRHGLETSARVRQ